MKTNKKIGIVIVAVSILFTLGLTSCGVAGFGVTVSPSDVKGIDLSDLHGSDYIIKVETYVETGDMGIDLSKLVYDYTLKNHSSSKDLRIEVRLSLYGEATIDDNDKISILIDSNGNGYEDEDSVWLSSTYNNTVSSEGYGWASMIGSPSSPVPLAHETTVIDDTTLEDNSVVDRILKQDGVWIDVYVIPDFTSFLFSSGDLMDVIDQSIQVEGSKATGYYPGFFGTM